MKIFDKLIERLYLKQSNNLAYYDQLTKLHNRTYYDLVCKTKYNHKELFVSFVDVNNLKKINDEFGHHVGSEKLKLIAERLQALPYYELIRLSGDEFIVLHPREIDFCKLDFISVGTVKKSFNETLSEAVHKADNEMYEIKHNTKENLY